MKIFQELLGLAFLVWPLVLVVLILLAFILAISVSVFVSGRTGFNKWAGAFVGFLIIYLAVFWDWIPTVVAHKHYCEKEAGFWIHKTLEQWKAENPGVAETLVANKKLVKVPGGYALNQRFLWLAKQDRYFPLNYMMRREERVVDSMTGEVLARHIDFSSRPKRPSADGEDWKFWLNRLHCAGELKGRNSMRQFKDSLRGAKR